MTNILFPGRHHMLTNFQHDYLKNLVDKGIDGEKVDKIIFAVTSSNHANTRRNPLPLYLRALEIEKFSRDLDCEIKIYPIPDVVYTDKFAKYLTSQIFYQGQELLTPRNTLLACSTPELIDQFKILGYTDLPVELVDYKNNRCSTLRPWEVVEMMTKSGKNWRQDENWKRYASKASQEIYSEYNLGDLVVELFSDSLLNDDADITDTRDYNVYARSMDQNADFKFNDIKPFVLQGKIVDAGCGTGALVNLLSKNFPESDIIGVEATRKFYEYCQMQDYSNPFVFFYRKNIHDQNFKENSINTFIYSSVLHEVYSYMGKIPALKQVLRNTHTQLAPGGRMIIRDVVGPENGKEIVYLELNDKDGDLDVSGNGDIKRLSTYSKFFHFANDFKPRSIDFCVENISGRNYIKTTMQNAYEYISKMNYVDNWYSEMHEEFGYWNIGDWKRELEDIGFDIVEGSRTFSSPYIIDKMYSGKATIYRKVEGNLVKAEYPATNIILAAEKKYPTMDSQINNGNNASRFAKKDVF